MIPHFEISTRIGHSVSHDKTHNHNRNQTSHPSKSQCRNQDKLFNNERTYRQVMRRAKEGVDTYIQRPSLPTNADVQTQSQCQSQCQSQSQCYRYGIWNANANTGTNAKQQPSPPACKNQKHDNNNNTQQKINACQRAVHSLRLLLSITFTSSQSKPKQAIWNPNLGTF